MTTASLWHPADHPLETVTDPLPTDRVDDLVVGAGITGLTTALLLARAGRRVAVVEAHAIGESTTGRTTGKVSLLQGITLSRMAKLHGRQVMESYVVANTEGQAWLRRFCADHDVRCDVRDGVTYASSSDDLPTVREEHDVAARLGLPVRWTDDVDLPFPTPGATVLADQAQVDPQSLLLALAEQVRSHGGTITTGRRVVHVPWSSAGATLDDGTQVRSRTVTLATGAPIVDRALHFARLTPERSYIAAWRWQGDDLPMAISPAPYGSVRDATTTDGGRLVLVGGGSHPVGRQAPTSDRARDLRRWAEQHLGVEGAPIAEWSAQDYTTHDRVPSVGRLPRPADAYVATGFAKWGMTNGVAAARSLSARILGAPVAWDLPERRRATGPRAAGRLVKQNAEVGVQMATGWARATRPSEGREALHHDAPDGECRVVGVCTHLGGMLRWNDLEKTWDCPLHGSRFSPDGEVLDGPATRPLRRSPR